MSRECGPSAIGRAAALATAPLAHGEHNRTEGRALAASQARPTAGSPAVTHGDYDLRAHGEVAAGRVDLRQGVIEKKSQQFNRLEKKDEISLE